MKNLLTTLSFAFLFFIAVPADAQVVYVTEWKSDAQPMSGIWYFTEWRNDADIVIYFTEWRSEADIVIAYTEWKSDAVWRQ